MTNSNFLHLGQAIPEKPAASQNHFSDQHGSPTAWPKSQEVLRDW